MARSNDFYLTTTPQSDNGQNFIPIVEENGKRSRSWKHEKTRINLSKSIIHPNAIQSMLRVTLYTAVTTNAFSNKA